jgi:YHS domain-containing protein
MGDEKKCLICNTTESKNWIERQNIAGQKAYFCTPEHYSEYKKKAAETGVCEFC